MTKLRELQLLFQQSLQRRDNSVAQYIAKLPNLTVDERLQIYYKDYYFRLRDALKDDYKKLCRWIGDKHFNALAHDYLIRYPSRTFSIRKIGFQFPDYLDTCNVDKAIIEMSRFECLMIRSLYASDAGVLTLQDLASLDPNAWETLCLKIQPSLYRLVCEFNTLGLWSALDENQEISSVLLEEPTTIITWRYKHQTFFRALTSEETILLDQIERGQIFPVLCEVMLDYFDEDQTVEWVVHVLQSWVNDGIFVSLS